MLNPLGLSGEPTNQGERFHKPKEKLYICTMNIRTLSIGAVMPSEILSNFEMVRVEEESSLIASISLIMQGRLFLRVRNGNG